MIMNILIVYFSNTGNTKRVAELVGDKLQSTHQITIKNALTTTPENVEWSDIIIIGSPIHGYILFGQKFCSQVMKFITNTLPDDLHEKKIILFATYMFSPGRAFKKVEKKIITKNGNIIGTFGEKRAEKDLLSESIKKEVTDFTVTY